MPEQLRTRWRFFIVPHSVFNQSTVSSRAKLVYCALAHYANRDLESFPAVATIGEACSMSETTARLGIRELQRAGLLTKQPQIDEATGAQRTNLYTLNAPEDLGDNRAEDGEGGSESAPRGVRNPDGGGSESTTAPLGKSTPRTRPTYRDPCNHHCAQPSVDLAPVVVAKYREITGLNDLSLDLVWHWIETYGYQRVESKLLLMQANWASVRVPAAFLGKAIRHNWETPVDIEGQRIASKRKAEITRTEKILREAVAAEAVRRSPEGRAGLRARWRGAKDLLAQIGQNDSSE